MAAIIAKGVSGVRTAFCQARTDAGCVRNLRRRCLRCSTNWLWEECLFSMSTKLFPGDDPSIVLVVTPLTAIMKDQVRVVFNC